VSRSFSRVPVEHRKRDNKDLRTAAKRRRAEQRDFDEKARRLVTWGRSR